MYAQAPQQQCPVCTLFLHAGMNLEAHLETHPKDQVIKALVAATLNPPSGVLINSNTAITRAPPPHQTNSNGHNAILYHDPHSNAVSTNLIEYTPQQTPQQPPPQPNFLIVNSTSTKFFRRSNAAIIINNQPPPPSHLHQTPPLRHNSNHNNSGPALDSSISSKCDRQYNQSSPSNANNHSMLGNSINHSDSNRHSVETVNKRSNAAIDNYEDIPQKYDTINNNDTHSSIDPSLCNTNSNSNNVYYEHDHSSSNLNNNISNECGLQNITECEEDGNEIDNMDSSSQIAAKYFEQDNGDFVVQESPKAYVEYTENDEGDFMVTEKIVRTPMNVIHFEEEQDDEESQLNNENQIINEHDEYIDVENVNQNTPPEMFEFSKETKESMANKKTSPAGLKVLSNVKLTPDMISSGIKDIISSAKSVNLNDNHNAKISPKITENIEFLSDNDDDEYLVVPSPRNDITESPQASSKPTKRNKNSSTASITPPPATTTSVIRMASTTPTESCFKEPAITPLLIQSKTPFKLNLIKKQPKKLVLKLKKPLPHEAEVSDNMENYAVNTNIKVEKFDNWQQPCSSKNFDGEQNIKIEIEDPKQDVTSDKDDNKESLTPLVFDESIDTARKIARVKKRRVSVKTKKFRALKKLSKLPERNPKRKLFKSDFQKPGHSKHCKQTKAIKQHRQSTSNDDEVIDGFDEVEVSMELHPEIQSEKFHGSQLPSTADDGFVHGYVHIHNDGYVQPTIATFTNNLYSELKVEETELNEPSTSVVNRCYPESALPSSTELVPSLICEIVTNEEIKPNVEDQSSEPQNIDDSKDSIQNLINNDNEEVKISQSVSWTSEITTAIETIESHQSSEHNILPSYTCTTTETTIQKETKTLVSDPVEWKPNSEELMNYDDINNQAGPSYRFPNFTMGNYDPEFLFPSTERPTNRFLEFIEDGQTATWKHPFSPQYVNFESDRNSYMDLDTCKTTNLPYNRAPSTESINIRTDEKMPAKGEISEQESNGEIDVSWNPQLYQYCHQESLPKYFNPHEQSPAGSKEPWKAFNENNFQQFSQTIPKFNQSTEVVPTYSSHATENDVNDNDVYIIEKKPNLDVIDIDINKKEKKPRCYRCSECYAVFQNLRLKRAHIKQHHPDSLMIQPKVPIVPTATTVIKEDNKELESKLFFSSITDRGLNMYTTFEFNRNELSVTAEPPQTVKTEDGAEVKKKIMGFDELKNELLQTTAATNGSGGIGGGTQIPKIIKILKTKKVYVCQKCNEEFKSIRCFDKHMGIHPAECQQCGKSFRHWSNLSVHLKRHLGIKNYACRCGKKFVLKQNLDEHMRIHTGTAPIVCVDCPRKFRRYSNLIQHRNRHHLNIKRELKDYVCHCGEVFHTKAKFSWHKEIHDKKPKGCPYCRERFIHKNSLTRHIRLSHAEKYWFFKSLHKTKNQAVECPICNQLYLKTSIKHHINKHNVKTDFKCNICNKVFSTKWNLKQHRWIHACRSTKPYKCKVCTSAFVRESDYVTHMNIHKSIRPFTCDYCGRQFSRKYNWLRHTREHELPKKFKCNICNKTFHRAYYLTEHSRVHTGERPYSCNICGKTSATKTNHNKHIVIHHARDPLAAEG